MDFLKSFKKVRTEFNKEYINVCKFIDDIRNKEYEPIANIALAIQYFELQNKLSTFSVTEKLTANMNSNNDEFNEFLNKIVSYGEDYIGGIKKDEYSAYKHLFLNKKEICNLPEFKNTIEDQDDGTDIFKSLMRFREFFEKPKYIQNRSYVSLLEAACIISRDIPSSIAERIGALDITEDWDFISARKYIIENIRNERLYIDEKWLGIPTYLLKIVLFEDDKIIKGFNDDILTSVYEELISPSIKLVLKNEDDLKQPVEINIPPNRIDGVMNSYPMALEKKVKKLEEEIESYEATKDDLTIKDSAYLLIAVMKDLLLDPDITGYFFQTDKHKGFKEPTQTELTNYIDAKDIKGLKARAINSLFSEANKKINDNLKK